MDDARPLASLSLTHVSYDPSDPVSYACAWLSLVPQGLMVAYATLLWATREAEIALMFAGQLACEALNFALKRLIREERPKQMLGKGYGMPSSHAQFLAFFAVYLSLFLLLRHRPQPSTVAAMRLPSARVQAVLISAGAAAVAVAVAASRVYLSYHTLRQVLAGDLAGVVSGVVWFVATGVMRTSGALGLVLDSWPARVLRVRDLLPAHDLPESGWRAWLAARAPPEKKRKAR